MLLQISLEWPCSVYRIVSGFDDMLHCAVGEFEINVTVSQSVVDVLYEKSDDATEIVLGERLEHDDLIKTVQKLGAEVCP